MKFQNTWGSRVEFKTLTKHICIRLVTLESKRQNKSIENSNEKVFSACNFLASKGISHMGGLDKGIFRSVKSKNLSLIPSFLGNYRGFIFHKKEARKTGQRKKRDSETTSFLTEEEKGYLWHDYCAISLTSYWFVLKQEIGVPGWPSWVSDQVQPTSRSRGL